MSIGHLLFDADGVLQHGPHSWTAAVEPYLGDRAEEFLQQLWRDERPSVVGQGDFLVALRRVLAAYGVEESAEMVFEDVWQRILPVPETISLTRSLKRAGYGVHLATNQNRHRGEYLRNVLGYDSLFDVSCYSHDLGVAKPDPAFFVEASRRIGAPPAEIVLVDDSPTNVEAARSVGLAGILWNFEQGPSRLLRGLASVGIVHGAP